MAFKRQIFLYLGSPKSIGKLFGHTWVISLASGCFLAIPEMIFGTNPFLSDTTFMFNQSLNLVCALFDGLVKNKLIFNRLKNKMPS